MRIWYGVKMKWPYVMLLVFVQYGAGFMGANHRASLEWALNIAGAIILAACSHKEESKQ